MDTMAEGETGYRVLDGRRKVMQSHQREEDEVGVGCEFGNLE